MLRRFSPVEAILKRWLSAKAMVQIDEVVNNQLENAELHPRRHPGILKSKAIVIPQWVENGIMKAVAEYPIKNLRIEGKKLAAYLNQRHPPPEKADIDSKFAEVKNAMLEKISIDLDKFTHEELEEFWRKKKFSVESKLKQHIYAWVPLQFDYYKSLIYMVGCGIQNYAALYRVFNEIYMNDKNFEPKTLFDFGSGIGTVAWAASEFWKQSLGEYYCVDSSADMNKLAEFIMGKPSHLKNVYFRQFLPASTSIKSDIVVSAYSLFELPNAHARLAVLLNLWLKTEKYLVIIERGTNAGFKLVNEARDFILEMSSKSLESENPNPFHVFSPCPHDSICPRYITDNTPCNFQVPYFTLSLGQITRIDQERYSYVVLKKGQRPEDDKQWPRIVRPPLLRSKLAMCRMCTAAGKLEEIIFTAAKHGKSTYKCAKYSKWGDKLPLKIVDVPKTDDPE